VRMREKFYFLTFLERFVKWPPTQKKLQIVGRNPPRRGQFESPGGTPALFIPGASSGRPKAGVSGCSVEQTVHRKYEEYYKQVGGLLILRGAAH
jgi:hypothetical protein